MQSCCGQHFMKNILTENVNSNYQKLWKSFAWWRPSWSSYHVRIFFMYEYLFSYSFHCTWSATSSHTLNENDDRRNFPPKLGQSSILRSRKVWYSTKRNFLYEYLMFLIDNWKKNAHNTIIFKIFCSLCSFWYGNLYRV